jgi:hypothetical protein
MVEIEAGDLVEGNDDAITKLLLKKIATSITLETFSITTSSLRTPGIPSAIDSHRADNAVNSNKNSALLILPKNSCVVVNDTMTCSMIVGWRLGTADGWVDGELDGA